VGQAQDNQCNGNSEVNGTSPTTDDSGKASRELGIGLGVGIPSLLVALAGVLVAYYRRRGHKKGASAGAA